MEICLPKSGSAAQILYRGHSSSPIVEAMSELLSDGMVMIDIGAHIGEYTLIGAKLVGPIGQVHALEPQPTLVEMIKQNAARNDLTNVKVYNCAVADFNGSVSFITDPGSMSGWIAANPGGATAVPCTTLEQLVLQNNLARIDLVKIDAAGNELSVLQGGTTLLSDGRPAIICKLYHPAVIAERFGYDARMTIELLRSYKYELFLLDRTAEAANRPVYSLDQLREHFDRGAYCLHILALRNGRRVPQLTSIFHQ